MNRNECRIVAGFLAVAIALAPIGSPAAADAMNTTANKTGNKAGQVRAKSTLSAEAPLLGRVVITPSAEQMAKIRLERRMIGLKNLANEGEQAGSGHPATTGAL